MRFVVMGVLVLTGLALGCAAVPLAAEPAAPSARREADGQGGSTSRDPVATFDYAWRRLDRNYAQFVSKHVDWDAIYRVYRPQVTPETTDAQLWEILVAMLRHLNDAHVCLQDESRRQCGGVNEGLKPAGFSRDLVRSKYLKGKVEGEPKGKVAWGWLTSEIGYLQIVDFKGNRDPILRAVDAGVAAFAQARALVVDVRDNTGGNGGTAAAVAGRFADRARFCMAERTRYGVARDAFGPPSYANVEPAGPKQFTAPTVLLTDRFTASAAEHVVLALRVLPQVTVVGNVTEGACSSQFPDRLPNGWTLWTSFVVIADQNGASCDGVGIAPDLWAVNTAADVAAERDRPLEFAVRLLETGRPAAQDESSSLVNVRRSLVAAYLQLVEEKGVDAAAAEVERLRTEGGSGHFFSPVEAVREAGPLLGRKQYAEALGLLQACQRAYPPFASVYAMMAQAHLGMGNLASAKAVMAQGERVEPMLPWEVPDIEQAKLAIRKQEFGAAAPILEKALAQGGVEAAERTFKELQGRHDRGGPVFDERDLVRLGYALLKAKQVDRALFVFEKTVTLYPESSNAYDSLGEAQMTAGRRDQAIASYRRALALDPTNRNARATLKELEKGK